MAPGPRIPSKLTSHQKQRGRGKEDSHVDFTDLHGGGPAHTMTLNSRTEVVNIQYIKAPFCVVLPYSNPIKLIQYLSQRSFVSTLH